MTHLIVSGDIFYTPPAYVCNLEPPKEDYLIQNRQDHNTDEYSFKDTLAGLTVKALQSCDQTDALCTVVRYTEKVLL